MTFAACARPSFAHGRNSGYGLPDAKHFLEMKSLGWRREARQENPAERGRFVVSGSKGQIRDLLSPCARTGHTRVSSIMDQIVYPSLAK
jgi:hypothetical protein